MQGRGLLLRGSAAKKDKSLDKSWWDVPEEKFAAAAAAERDRLARVDSAPTLDPPSARQMRKGG